MGCVPTTGASVPNGPNCAPRRPRSQGVIENFSGVKVGFRTRLLAHPESRVRAGGGRSSKAAVFGTWRVLRLAATGTDHRAGYTDTTDLGIPSDLGRHRSRFGLRDELLTRFGRVRGDAITVVRSRIGRPSERSRNLRVVIVYESVWYGLGSSAE